MWSSDFDLHTTRFLMLLAETSLKAMFVLVFVRFLIFFFRRASASLRHVFWLLGLLSLPILLGLSLIFPVWEIPILKPWAEPKLTTESEPELAHVIVDLALVKSKDAQKNPIPREVAKQPLETAANPQNVNDTVEQTSGWFAYSWWTWDSCIRVLFVIWLCGFLLILTRLFLGVLRLRHMERTLPEISDDSTQQQLQQLIREIQLNRSVLLLKTKRPIMPMTWAIWKPVILLPAVFEQWSQERLRMILLHELAHIKRRDCYWQSLTEIVRALFWFHPVVWWALAWFRLEQEHACDDMVLQHDSEPTDYAEHLLAVSSGHSTYAPEHSVALAMSRIGFLKRRMVSILDPKQRRSSVNRTHVFTYLLLGVAILAPLALVTTYPAKADDSEARAEPSDQTDPDKAKAKDGVNLVKRILKEHYVKPLDEKKMEENAIRGMIRGLDDPYSAYYTPDAIARFNSQIKGELVGIGVQLKQQDKQLVVVSPIENSPALKAGVRASDIILAIDGKATKDLSLTDCVDLIRGKKGTTVRLKLRHDDGKEETVKVTRGQLVLASVKGIVRGKNNDWQYLLDPKHKIGYLRITSFSSKTPKEMQTVIEGLKKQGMTGLILDLRHCPGGLMHSAIDVCDMFLSDGTIVSVKGMSKKEKSYKATKKVLLGKTPLVVLIDQSTASSAEIVSGALKDNKRAVLLGSRTYGKGSVQTIISLNNGAALKLTTAYHYLPSGRNIGKKSGGKTWGVDPNDGFYVPLSAKQSEVQHFLTRKRDVLLGKTETPNLQTMSPQRLEKEFADPQLAAALKTMRAKLASGTYDKVGKSLKELQSRIDHVQEIRNRQATLKGELDALSKELELLK